MAKFQYLGARFSTSEQVQVTAIGGHMYRQVGTVFGAIVRLSGPNALPTGSPVDADWLATTVFDAGSASSDVRVPLSVTLPPGDYALIFGSERFGAFGFSFMPSNNPNTAQASYFVWNGSTGPLKWLNGIVGQLRFVVEGEIIVSDSDGPVTTAVTADPNPVAIGSNVDLTANVDDTNTGGSNIASAEYSLDGGAFTAMTATDNGFDELSEEVETSFNAPAEAGIYDLCVRGTDEPGNIGDPECIMLVVYDPSGGFVTGGGWIDSPAGAYIPDDTLTGKANFGFVSKYKKGATVPTGNTEFQFKAGDLNFHSSSYDFLVITTGGTNAQFKGYGMINGGIAPNGMEYRFMIWAHDDSPDTFRIKIWYEGMGEEEEVVYDNVIDQEIGGGSIVIHTKGNK